MHRHARNGMTLPACAQTIAVIGAGLAGLACAQQLQAAGYAVTLFDQADAPGGRMRHCAGQEWQCDYGAQYFTARDPAFAAVVDAWIDAGVAAPWQARIASWDGARLSRSQTSLTRYVGVPDMAAPARWLAANLDVHLCTEACALHLGGQGWSVSFAQGAATHMFDAVLLAVPAPDAVALVAQIAPAFASIAQQAHMHPAWAVMAHFDGPIDPGYDALFVNAGPLRWVARNASKPARAGVETWLLHATAEWSQTHGDATPANVIASLLPELAALGLPMPQSCDAFFWTVASSAPALQIGCAWDAQLGLGMCGDWMAGGKVEGAWQSGVALARCVSAGDVPRSGCN
ncbi:NAD/FAD-dependent oxidoreductase [Xanthomonas oryzae]|uniref:NAD/FAD-dependent oxidoreductase n=1 Tax=Xanthomonas oryzae TaxID=347 RepID=A0AAP1EY89_9XANT|nr:FAD-dependent oxidoreductase [Xanthomonas oryzae]KOR40980.1 NAD/FAD-dependent oxidoreductase [Xanthomonas oryzae]QBG84351.1 FAD-dependent oxidoreductase [Xanthomonas oryzae]